MHSTETAKGGKHKPVGKYKPSTNSHFSISTAHRMQSAYNINILAKKISGRQRALDPPLAVSEVLRLAVVSTVQCRRLLMVKTH